MLLLEGKDRQFHPEEPPPYERCSLSPPRVKDVDKVACTYDELGRVTGRTLNAPAESITLDALGRATAATNALGSFITGYVNATRAVQNARGGAKTRTGLPLVPKLSFRAFAGSRCAARLARK